MRVAPRLGTLDMLTAQARPFPRHWDMAATVSVTEFITAVVDGDIDTVATMLRQRPELVELDAAGNDERRALHYAVMGRDVEMVAVLMTAGADARKGIWPFRDTTDAHTLARDRGFDDVVAAIEAAEQRRREAMSCPRSSVTPVQEEIKHAIRRAENVEATRLLEADESRLRACDLEGGSPLHAARRLSRTRSRQPMTSPARSDCWRVPMAIFRRLRRN